MNPNDTPPPVPKKGMSGLAIAGIGCGTLLLLTMVAGGLLVMKGCQKFKEVAGDLDFEKNPTKAAALMALRLNPELEIVSTNDATGEVTVKYKQSGETVTMSFEDIAQGKFTIKNDKGETITMDASNAEKQGVVVTGPDGHMVIGGTQSAPPEWVPQYPGARSTGGMKNEKGASVNGSFAAETTDSVAKVREFYDARLKAEGYETSVTSTQGDGGEMVMISGNKEEGKRTVNVMIQGEAGKTTVAYSYSLDAGN